MKAEGLTGLRAKVLHPKEEQIGLRVNQVHVFLPNNVKGKRKTEREREGRKFKTLAIP